jgi:hypothetical protein
MELIMNVVQFIMGIIIAVAVCAICTVAFTYYATDYAFVEGINLMIRTQTLGKVITICSVSNIAVFFVLLKFNKIMMARGIIAGLILLALITILV